MNRYKSLINNTIIFAVGTFSSKILTIIMTRFITGALSQSDFSTATTLQDVSNILIPFFSFQIIDAITRFGLDRRYRKSDVFSVSILAVCIGSAIMFLISPLLERIPFLYFIQGRSGIVALFVFASSFHSICSQFVRARNMVKLYTFQGILTTVLTAILTLIFLYPMNLGVTGYLLGIIVPDALVAVFLFWTANLHKFVRFKGLSRLTAGQMIRYAIPLIPNKVAFWITNTSDRIMVVNLCGQAVNGVFSAAYKIPNLISLVSGVFMDAWQMSSITEEKHRASFFTTVFRAMTALIFTGSACIILLCQPLMALLTSSDYHEGWVYIPLLVIATSFSCLCSFVGTVYMVEKRSINNMVTSLITAGLNVVLNFLLIPPFGPNGAAMATLLSYMIQFIIRIIDTRRFIRINFSPLRLLADFVIVLAESLLMVQQVFLWPLWCVLLTLLIIAMNAKLLLQSVRKVLPSRIAAKLPGMKHQHPAPARRNQDHQDSEAPSLPPEKPARPNRYADSRSTHRYKK